MSIEETSVVDAIGSNENGDDVVLLISDHWSWDDENDHLVMLQEKINTYIRFYECGELYKKYPSFLGRKVIIKIDFKYNVPDRLSWFIDQVRSIVEPIGLGIEYDVFE